MATPTEVRFPPDVHLIESDGEPYDSSWHRDAMALLIEQIRYHLRHRQDYFVGGNMFIYFSLKQVRNRDFRGPDFFFVNEVEWNPLRKYWVVWEEDGKYPDFILELLSPTTIVEDLTTKKTIYQNIFHTREYMTYDPDTQNLQGWRLVGKIYEPIRPNDTGWLWSEELQLWLGVWRGPYQGVESTWLRFFDQDGNVVAVFAEAERQKTEAARKKADAEKQRADTERQRADAEHRRVQELEAELARLKQEGK